MKLPALLQVRFLYLVLGLLWLSSATPVLQGQDSPGLPEPAPGGAGKVITVQLEGELMCPPLRLGPRLIVAATNDRRIQAVDTSGNILWRHDFLRQVRGPLRGTRNGCVQLGVGTRQLALLSSQNGRLIRTVTSPADYLIALDDSRWLGLSCTASQFELILLNPDGSPLCTQALSELELFGPGAGFPQTVRDPAAWSLDPHDPAGDGAALVFAGTVHASPRRWRVSPDFEVSPSPAEPRPQGSVAALDAQGAGYAFGYEQSGSAYTVRITRGPDSFNFDAPGRLVQGLADNRSPPLCIWADTRWKLHVYPAQGISRVPGEKAELLFSGQASPGTTMPGATVPMDLSGSRAPVPGTGKTAIDYEMDYLREQERLSPPSAIPWFVTHVGSLMQKRQMSGRLYPYEDHLLELLENSRSSSDSFSLRHRLLYLETLASFPSSRWLSRLESLFLGEEEPLVISGYLDWFAAFGADPDGSVVRTLGMKTGLVQRQIMGSGITKSRRSALQSILKRMVSLIHDWQG